MFRKYELIGAGISVLLMAAAIYLFELRDSLTSNFQAAQVIESQSVIEGDSLANDLLDSLTPNGKLKDLVIDDVKIGVGEGVKEGDVVSVHYIGTLSSGQEFDNSRKKGSAFTFTVGEGEVIAGWDQGVIGMKKQGQRILVIPPHLAYGKNGIGPIPGDATLVFAIELIDIE